MPTLLDEPEPTAELATRAKWLADRQEGVGSSDAPCLVGLGWKNATDIYREKTTSPDARPPAGFLRRGLELEGIVAGMYVESGAAIGAEIAKPEAAVAHPDRPWQLANLDRVRDDDRPVELKTTAGFGDEWGPAGSDIVPEGYLVQCQHQMGVVGADWCDLAALDVIAWEFRVYRIPFSPAFFDFLTNVEAAFWAQVVARQPVGPEWSEQFADPARSRMVKGKAIDLPDAAELIEQRKAFGAIRDEADAEYRRLGARIEAMLGDAEAATAGPWKVKRVNVKAHRVEAHDKPASSYIRCDRKKGTA